MVKAAGAGLLGSLIIFVVIGVKVTGVAPFNLPPSAAFLEVLGPNRGPVAPIVYFLYGALWAVILLALFREGVTVGKGGDCRGPVAAVHGGLCPGDRMGLLRHRRARPPASPYGPALSGIAGEVPRSNLGPARRLRLADRLAHSALGDTVGLRVLPPGTRFPGLA